MSGWIICAIVMALAAANGANDNIKGAATLVGSGLMGYRGAIRYATLATAAGGLLSIWLAEGLLSAFSGKGLVPQELITSAEFPLAVAAAAGLTIWLATWRGLPVSTTHALLGGLLGAGLALAPAQVEIAAAANSLLLPLLLSPFAALLLALVLVPMVRRLRARPAHRDPCVCRAIEPALGANAVAVANTRITLGTRGAAACQPAVGGSAASLPLGLWLDRAHLGTAAAVSFARGLNDTPKIAALLVVAGLTANSASALVVVAMALGGLAAAGRVANTLAHRITRMDTGEALGGNLVTSSLVIAASQFSLPVSTTHVSTGALFGIAAGNGTGNGRMIRQILLAWGITLPVAAGLAYAGIRFLS